MKIQFSILAGLMLLTAGARADDKPVAPSNPDFQLQIQADHDSYFGGEPIVLTVTLTNKTDRARDVGVYGPKAEWTVKGHDGKPVAITAQGAAKSVRRSLVSQSIAPGQALVYRVIVNRFYDMTAADEYEVTAQRWPIAESRKPGDVTAANFTSNTVKVSVAEEDEQGK